MSLYRYRALAANGRHVRGELEAGDLAELEHRLRPLGLMLINGEPRRRARRPAVRVPRRELIHFCFHLEQLLSAGIPPFDSLAALRDASPHPRTRAMVCALLAAVERGKPLSDAAAALPGAFSPVAVGLLRAGEAAGTLPQAVRDIGAALARDDELATHARRIAIYPAIVGGILLLAVVVALTELVPELEKLARSTGQALPLQTRILVALSHAVRDWGWALLLALASAASAAAWALARSAALRLRADALQLALPLVGEILRKLALARFAALFATLYGAGINVLDTLHTTEEAVGNRALRAGLRAAGHSIEQGSTISDAFAAAGVFPPLVTRMLKLGEHTGALDRALDNVATLYRRDVSESIARLQAAAEPALTLVMGGLLLWIASAVLGPIYALTSHLPG
ncbi:type II secretion system F family protein [Thauera aromatica]|uniref:type II secretion system F family protein n=1 Tax=Thauera aromatica TaxID=59405 RepID=UPI001FFD0638|nr:type II secretion system F family protein [Thauera aromatica]MCK2089794.1 type II secretion system F family protein [Thauera aromatica]MCK2126283.1 type II secretion system F family protein [Thauera aromatica]